MNITMLKKAIYILFITFLSISSLQASMLEIPNSQISINLPDKWMSFFDNGSLKLKSPDNKTVSMTFTVLKSKNIEQVIKESEVEINNTVGKLEDVQEATTGEINGLEFIEQNSTANHGKTAVSIALFKIPKGKFLMISSLGVITNLSEFGDDIEQIVSSVKPITKKVAIKPIVKPKSFPLPFSSNKALAFLFGQPNPNGVSSWIPSLNSFSTLIPNLDKTMATTKAYGFKSYKYDKHTTQTMFLYKTTFLKSMQNVSIIGATLFNCKNGNCKPIWNNPAIALYGTYNNKAPAKFVRIGQNSHGAIIEGGGTHQGITEANAILLAVHNNKIVIAAKDIPIYEDNKGAIDDPSLSYKFRTNIDFLPSEHKRFYNMKVKFSGTTIEHTKVLGQMVSRIIPANFTNSYFWNDKGFYEQEIECDGPAIQASSDDSKINAMLPVFDSVIKSIYNEYTILNASNYSSKNKKLVWAILYHLAINHGESHPLVKVDNYTTMHVPYKVMQEFATTCFSDYDDLRALPRSPQVSFDKRFNRFNLEMSDSGLSFCKILYSKAIKKGFHSVSVGYYSEEEEPLSATYEFIITPNTYATAISNPLFHFSIVSVKKVK